MTAPLRILHAVRSDGFAGVERFVSRLATAQARAGHHIQVVGGAEEHMQAALDAAEVGFRPAARTREVHNAIRRVCREVDVVNTHMTAADGAALTALAVLRRRPTVVSTRHFASPRGRVAGIPIDPLVHRVIDAEISVSNAVAAAIGVPSTVIHPGVDSIEPPDGVRARVVLMAQRLQPEKSSGLGLRAFAESGLASDGWRLVVAGDGDESEDLRVLATDLGIADAVTFLGFASDVPSLMNDASILLATSAFEHFGLTVLEAMALGLPVVAAHAGGHVEMLGGLDRRALFPPGDASAAAVRLRSLADDAIARASLGRAERARQAARFTLHRQVHETTEVYRRSIEIGRTGS